MAAGDKPLMVQNGGVTWQKANFGDAPIAGAWSPFGYRLADLRDPGPVNAWQLQRSWNAGREATKLDLLAQDYGGPLGEFKLTDLHVPGFAWGQEVNAPAALGGGFYRHTATPTVRHPPAVMHVQIHDEDADGNAERTTFTNGVMPEVELAGSEGGETSVAPTFIFQGEDQTIAKNTVTPPSATSYKHFHGYVEFYGTQFLRIRSWRFRKVSKAERSRFWNQANPGLAYEYPLEDVNYVFSCRAEADAKAAALTTRTLRQMAVAGDIGTAKVKIAKVANQDEAQVTIGSANDALGIIGAPRVRPAAGGKVMLDVDFVARTSQYEWVDTSNVRYFPS